jgi:hypothetical protein
MPYDTVRKFEETIANYAGSKYAVAVDSGTNALFLSCLYKKVRVVTIPKFTYPSVACCILNSFKLNQIDNPCLIFRDDKWNGIYSIAPYNIIDSALRFQKGMYIPDTLYCLSFHLKKHLPIGRGGMILTNDKRAYVWLKKARFDGRSELPLNEDMIDMLGWNMYMTPEQAARGLCLFNSVKDLTLADIDSSKQNDPDLSKIGVYKCQRTASLRK